MIGSWAVCWQGEQAGEEEGEDVRLEELGRGEAVSHLVHGEAGVELVGDGGDIVR